MEPWCGSFTLKPDILDPDAQNTTDLVWFDLLRIEEGAREADEFHIDWQQRLRALPP